MGGTLPETLGHPSTMNTAWIRPWCGAALGWMLAVVTAIGAGVRPLNVVVLLADDLGQRDLGCYGSRFYETPNLDRLAGEGARFTDAYAACPVCSPTRASLLTGLWPQRTGVTDYLGAPDRPERWARNTRSLPAPFADRLAIETPTLPALLKSAGFDTFFAGKWHLGPEGAWPENHGFDVNRGGIDRGGPYGGKQYFSPYGNLRLTDGPPGEHLPDRLATETIRFMDEHRNRPFLAWYSFYDVHTPLQAREDLKAKYAAKRERMGLVEHWGREEPRDVRLSQDHVVYAAMVEAMDAAVGKVLDRIDALGLRDHTVVVFTSDNGGLSSSEGWPTSNSPLRAGKGWVYEGGIRVPLLIRWPGQTRAGSVIPTPVSSPDLLPTLLEAAGVKRWPGQMSDGISLAPLLQGGRIPERALFWHYPHYGNQGGAPAAALRRGDWKLVEWLEDGRTELFRLSDDLSESHDLSSREPRRVKSLKSELHAWQRSVGARFPEPNPVYTPVKPDGRVAVRNEP